MTAHTNKPTPTTATAANNSQADKPATAAKPVYAPSEPTTDGPKPANKLWTTLRGMHARIVNTYSSGTMSK